ncbi:alpha-L-rhamnosidase [Actinoalloteichus hoggarensis]|uniref:alpha-L-rhamnosidase n=1 Tax=Actinoalloteichus hoggarensis TaxID=1470176 RepID=A0A221W6I0_9PSEU|nr:alpha-L-rhamnosidase [Actinoalloteichus hoggarensis]ASO21273.1 Bacterial alpha-L-rhamnosidase [Actinoalloteichus hoggarensis]MBB5921205.1 alpha-L-rhamnosidase [Actinoalloteichus hoggarensis]
MGKGMNRRGFLHTSALGTGAGVAALSLSSAPAAAYDAHDDERPSAGHGAGRLRVERTTVEYADTLLGTDVTTPRLSWVTAAEGHGARQSAYQVQVTTDPNDWPRGRAWDSGRVASDRSIGVEYAGEPLRPRTRYHWRVRVWDGRGRRSDWSDVRWWETAMLGEDWQARWIGAPATEAPPTLDGTSWIWSADASPETAPVGDRWFHGELRLPPGAEIARARIVATADDDFTLYLGGARVLHAPEQVDTWRRARLADCTEAVRAAGEHVRVAVVAHNRPGPDVNPAGLLLRLLIELSDGETAELTSGAGWQVTDVEPDDVTDPDVEDGTWSAAAVLAAYGEGPWGDGVDVSGPERPAPLLRREFALPGPVTRARLYVSGLAYYEAEVNGRRVGTQVLDPGFTNYDETVLYTVHDVTDLLHVGDNALGVTLGRGFYGMTTPNVWNWHTPPWHGEPRLLARLDVDHADGSRTIVGTDADWRIAEGPTVSNSQFAGETYDARLARPGWSSPGFDDGDWPTPAVVSAPAGRLSAQQHEPIEVLATIRPVGITEPSPGVHVVDMGRTMAGWTRLSVRAPAGTRIGLEHGEQLDDDGRVIGTNGHVPGRHQFDEYVCAGGGTEVWEPRFSYKGFRYVEVTGLPEPPSPEQVLGRLVHSAVPEAGRFGCSEPFYEQLDRAMRRTLLNNFHGLPTDTPMFEKNGWTGDVQVAAPTMLFAFDLSRFLGKWIGDIADSQNADGAVPVIVPSSGWGYTNLAPSPEWTTVYPFLLREMYRVYADDRLVARHWDSLARYLDWEIDRLVDDLAITALGDWLPPGYQSGIPPEDTRLTATAYLCRALRHAAELGERLGRSEAAERYRTTAERCRVALNAAFLGPQGHYRTDRDPEYRQSSNAVPLAFGLVPPESEASVLASLVADIRARGDHLNTGCLGTSVLLPVLSAHGHSELAHAVATRRDYPSWGHWFDNGADTMWEMWEIDSRSRDHYFQGTVVQWLYENVAGLRPGDDGCRTLVVRPDARVGVDWARVSLDTVRGTAAVAWERADPGLILRVRVPVGVSAEVHVPAESAEDVDSTPAAAFLRMEDGHAVLRVDHGAWEFTSRVG